uniref:DDE Tnp4 domain-containing protein n=1 Tax=Glycine max TaxID=3847 RepID=A0A0R0F1K2_SOYBN
MEFLFKGTIVTGFASYAPSEDSRQNEGFNTRMKETNDNIDNNTKIDMTTQIMSSAKESGQRKRAMSSSLSSNDSSLSSSDSSSTDDDHITKKKVLMFVVPNVTNYFRNYVVKNPCRDSCMTDHRWERSKHSGETISRHFHSVLEVVCMFAKDIFKPIDSSFRDTPNEILKDARYRPYFRDCIGAIDEVYIGRKGYTTTNVMVFVTLECWEGSAHDTKIFMEALHKPALHFPYPPQGKYYLVDSGYPTFMGFLGPYKKTSLQRKIECVFGLCKARCKILGNMPPFDLKTQNQIIVACMAIHNFIQRNDKSDGEFDSLDEDNEYIDIDDDESEVGPSTTT